MNILKSGFLAVLLSFAACTTVAQEAAAPEETVAPEEAVVAEEPAAAGEAVPSEEAVATEEGVAATEAATAEDMAAVEDAAAAEEETVAEEPDDGYAAWRGQVLSEMDPDSADFAYRKDTKALRLLVAQHIIQASEYMGAHAADPVLFYIRGRLGKHLHGFYLSDIKEDKKPYRFDDPDNRALVEEYQSCYRRALDLDGSPQAPAHLDEGMLMAMNDLLTPPDISERILKKRADMDREEAGEDGGRDWYKYEFLLEAFVKAKDHDTSLKIVNEMLERFPGHERTDELLKYKAEAEAAIAKRKK